MYGVSEDFKTQIAKAQHFEHIRGTIDGTPFTEDNLISLSYSNRNSDSSDVSLGYAYVGQIEITFVNVPIIRGTWRGLSITLEYGLTLQDESVEWLPVGVFTISSAEWTDSGLKILASDIMLKFDIPFSSQTTGTPYNLLYLACQECGVTLDNTRAEIEALPNGTETFNISDTTQVQTYRDIIGFVSQALGGYATASRTGGLVVRSWRDSSVVMNILTRNRLLGSTFSDFATDYTGVKVTNLDGTIDYYEGRYSSSGTVIDLGANPLLQSAVQGVRDLQRQAIANVASNIRYTPYQITMLNNPALDLGDLISCSGGIAGSSPLTCAIMSIEWTFKETISLEGFGSDPYLSSAKSKQDKAISSLQNKKDGNQMIIHSFVNAEDFQVGNTETEIINIRFATDKTDKVVTWSEVNLDLDITDPTGIATAIVRYYLDDVVYNYTPTDSWDSEGKHLLNLMFPLESISGGNIYEWKVTLEMLGGIADIERGDIHSILEGQGLSEVEGDIIPPLDDSYVIGTIVIPPVELEDEEPIITIGGGGSYLDLENGTSLELENGTYLELEV